MPLSPDALEPLLRLSLVVGLGSQKLALLARHFGAADRVLRATPRELRSLPGLGPELARRIREFSGPAGDAPVARALEGIRRAEAEVLAWDDPLYPEPFRALPDAPFLLFAAGDLALLARPAIAFVGTRTPSAYGRRCAASLAGGVARAGYAVVSGMARGIDAEAHEAALSSGGKTIGVLGHGIDTAYPPENRALFRGVREAGLLVTEYPPGEGPNAGNFPKRNRLIAALSRGVVVVEMGLKSGAQHTVTYALEQGRDVMAVPGPIDVDSCAGTNQLIRDGARLVGSTADIIEEIEGVGCVTLSAREVEPPQPALELLAPDEDRVVRALSTESRHVDHLCAETGLGPAALLGLLLHLELRGYVEALPAKHFRRR